MVCVKLVQRMNQTWKDSNESSSFRTRCGKKEALSYCDLSSQSKKNNSQAIFTCKNKNISKLTMPRGLSLQELNTCIDVDKLDYSHVNYPQLV